MWPCDILYAAQWSHLHKGPTGGGTRTPGAGQTGKGEAGVLGDTFNSAQKQAEWECNSPHSTISSGQGGGSDWTGVFKGAPTTLARFYVF